MFRYINYFGHLNIKEIFWNSVHTDNTSASWLSTWIGLESRERNLAFQFYLLSTVSFNKIWKILQILFRMLSFSTVHVFIYWAWHNFFDFACFRKIGHLLLYRNCKSKSLSLFLKFAKSTKSKYSYWRATFD